MESYLEIFVDWYFSGIPELAVSGWIILVAVSVVFALLLIFDSLRRRLPAGLWRVMALLAVVPASPQIITSNFGVAIAAPEQWIAIAGGAGALLAVLVALSYSVRFRGLVGCRNDKRHPPYRAKLGECPVCARRTVHGLPGVREDRKKKATVRGFGVPRAADRNESEKVPAWLVEDGGGIYQLNEGHTSIGRSSENDIRLADQTTSRLHAKIEEIGGQYLLFDLGSATGTYLNGQRVRHPEPLKPFDTVTFGTATKMVFTTTPEAGKK